MLDRKVRKVKESEEGSISRRIHTESAAKLTSPSVTTDRRNSHGLDGHQRNRRWWRALRQLSELVSTERH